MPSHLQTRQPHIHTTSTTRTKPVTLTLEGVGGEVDSAGTTAREEHLPVDGHATSVQLAESSDQLAGFEAVAALGREEYGVVAAAESREDGLRTDLDEGADAFVLQGADAVVVADGATDMTDPVLRVLEVTRLGEPTGHIRHHRDSRRVVGQLGGDLPELRQHRLHQRRMESVGHLEPGGALEVR
ncbi:hypothetical protein, partial [Streptomyces sp. MN12]